VRYSAAVSVADLGYRFPTRWYAHGWMAVVQELMTR
jgi:hypothetical protein